MLQEDGRLEKDKTALLKLLTEIKQNATETRSNLWQLIDISKGCYLNNTVT